MQLQHQDIINNTTSLVAAKQSAEDFLESHCNSQHEDDRPGPVLCGDVSDIHSKSVTAAIATAYLNGFRAANEVFPYLTETPIECPK
ncbi:MAG: hypothetical protein R3C56_37870 [Pirellulaceae bacterium]